MRSVYTPGDDVASQVGAGCGICGRRAVTVSARLGVCGACVGREPDRALARAARVHAAARSAFDLPSAAPATSGGARCPLCARACQIGPGERGFCGLRTARGTRLVHLAGTAARGILHWYHDALPTNCVADWVCAGSSHVGKHNLAVFYASCTLDCLFCQNWHYRTISAGGQPGISAAELADAANAQTHCVCFFGGDPASQMAHALASARRLAARGVTVCWETAGTSHPKLIDHAVALSLDTGGCIKFDLKAYDDGLHRVLTGASNARTLENFARAAARMPERPRPPLVVASTPLVPGYIDAAEVGRLARFIASVNPDIPYALLAFAPHFYMDDLPRTSAAHAAAALAEAREAGLTNVRLGNQHLLSRAY